MRFFYFIICLVNITTVYSCFVNYLWVVSYMIINNHGQVMLKSDQPLRQATSPTKGKESDSARALQVSGDPHRRPRPASGFLGLHWCLGSKPQELVVRPLTADSCTPRTAAAAAARTLRQSFISRTGSSRSSSRAGCGHCLALLWHRYPQRLLLQQDFTSRPARHLPPAQLSQQRRKVWAVCVTVIHRRLINPSLDTVC